MGNSPSQSEDPDRPRELGDENDIPLSANSKPATWGFAPVHLRPPKAMLQGKRKRRTPLSRPNTAALKRSAAKPYQNNKRMRRQSPGEAIPRHILVSGGGTKDSPISLLDSDVEDDGTKESSLPSAAKEKRNKRPKNPTSTGRGSVLSQRQEQQEEETDFPRRHSYDGDDEKDHQREKDRTTAVAELVAPPFLSRERDGLSSPPVDSGGKIKKKSPAPEKNKPHDDDDEDSLMNLSRGKVNEASQKETADAIAATRDENSTETPARDIQESADEDAAANKQGRKDGVNDFPLTDGNSDGAKASSESPKNAPRLRKNGVSQRAADSTSSVDAGPNDTALIQKHHQERNSGKTGGKITGSVASKSPASVDLRLSPSSKKEPSSAARLGIVGNRRRMKKSQESGSPGMEGLSSETSTQKAWRPNSNGNGDVFDFDVVHPPSPKQGQRSPRESYGRFTAGAQARDPFEFNSAQASARAPDSRDTREQSGVHRELEKQSSTGLEDSASVSLKRNQIGVDRATANLDGFEKSSKATTSDASAICEKGTETTESRNQSNPPTNANPNPKNQMERSHNTEAKDQAPGRSRRKRRRRRRNDQEGDSPPMKVPPSLLPLNRPGKQNVPMVTNSRLRNRDGKNDKQTDVPYLKYPSLRRCEAILGKAGESLLGGQSGNRNLQDREERSSEESTTAEDPYLNHPKRCVVVTESKKQRCGQIVKSGKCCFCHNSHEENCSTNSPNVSFDAARRRGIRCVAAAKDGKQCTFATIGRQIVFCPMHIKDPPGKCFSIPEDFETGIEDHEEKEAGHEERSEKTTDSKVSGDDKEASEEDDQVECEEKEETYVQSTSTHEKVGQDLARLAPNNCFAAPDCSFPNTGTGGDQEDQMEESRPQAQSDETISSMGVSLPEDRIAPGLENRCVFVNIHERCRNESLPGGILCKFHWMRKEKNKLSLFDMGPMGEDHSELSGQSDSEGESSKTNDESDSSGEDALDAPEVNVGCDDESEGTASTMSSEPTICPQTGMYSHRAFTRLWKKAEDIIGQKTGEIEQTELVRRANKKVDSRDTTHQSKAQYGRILPKAMKRLMTIMNLEKDDVFVDIGHGIGNTCLHASYCIGCESRGIEVVSDRHSVADVFRGQLETFRKETDVSPPVGKIDLRLGKLEDPENTDFLTRGVTKAYVNNFNGVFSNRVTMKGTSDVLDGYIAGLFGLMKPGSVMVTLYPLSLYTDLDDTNKRREKNRLTQSKNASFFKREDVQLGPAGDCVQWVRPSGNKEMILVHKYTRLEQPNGEDAVFLCVNPNCENAVNDVPIRASVPNEEGRFVMNRCSLCNHNPKTLRSRRSRDGTEILPNYRV